jgi:hypothetical protein
MSSSNTPFPLLNYYAWKSRLGAIALRGATGTEPDLILYNAN